MRWSPQWIRIFAHGIVNVLLRPTLVYLIWQLGVGSPQFRQNSRVVCHFKARLIIKQTARRKVPKILVTFEQIYFNNGTCTLCGFNTKKSISPYRPYESYCYLNILFVAISSILCTAPLDTWLYILVVTTLRLQNFVNWSGKGELQFTE